jgi:fucose permease
MQTPQPQTVRTATIACYLSFLVLGAAATMLGPSFETLTTRFGLPLEQAGILTAIQFGAVMISLPLASYLLDRVNARNVLWLGNGLIGIGAFFLIFAATVSSLPAGLFAVLLIGLGQGQIDIAPNSIIAALNPDNAGIAVNRLNIFFGFGAIAGPQLVAAGLGVQDIRVSFFILGVASLILLFPYAVVNVRAVTSRSDKGQSQVNWGIVALFVLLIAAYIGIEAGYGAWIFTQVTKVALAPTTTASFAASLFWGGLTFGRWIASLVLSRLTNLQLMWATLVVILIGLGVLFLAPDNSAALLISAFLVGAGCGPIFPTVFVMLTDLYPTARNQVAGVFMTFGNLGAVLFPWLQGQVGGGRNGGMVVPLVLLIAEAIILGMIAMTITRKQVTLSMNEVD